MRLPADMQQFRGTSNYSISQYRNTEIRENVYIKPKLKILIVRLVKMRRGLGGLGCILADIRFSSLQGGAVAE